MICAEGWVSEQRLGTSGLLVYLSKTCFILPKVDVAPAASDAFWIIGHRSSLRMKTGFICSSVFG